MKPNKAALAQKKAAVAKAVHKKLGIIYARGGMTKATYKEVAKEVTETLEPRMGFNEQGEVVCSMCKQSPNSHGCACVDATIGVWLDATGIVAEEAIPSAKPAPPQPVASADQEPCSASAESSKAQAVPETSTKEHVAKRPRIELVCFQGCRWCSQPVCTCSDDDEGGVEQAGPSMEETSSQQPSAALSSLTTAAASLPPPIKRPGLFAIADAVLIKHIFVRLPWVSLLVLTSSCQQAVDNKREMVAVKLLSFAEIAAVRTNAAVANLQAGHKRGKPLTQVQLSLIFKLEWQTQACQRLIEGRAAVPASLKWADVLKPGVQGTTTRFDCPSFRLTRRYLVDFHSYFTVPSLT